MFCSKCGTRNEDGSMFCCQCGNKLVSDSKPQAPEYHQPPMNQPPVYQPPAYQPPMNQPSPYGAYAPQQPPARQQDLPLQPNGAAYSQEDYLTICQEYQSKRKGLYAAGVIFLVIGILIMLGGAIAGLLMMLSGDSSKLLTGIIIAVVSVIIGPIISGVGASVFFRKIKTTGEAYYRDYVNRINNR